MAKPLQRGLPRTPRQTGITSSPYYRPGLQRGEYVTPSVTSFRDDKSTPQYAQEAIDYSGREAKTGLKWATGKNIHRKTVLIPALPNAGSTSYAHGIVGLSTITRIWGICKDGTNYLPVPYADTAATGTQIEVYADATNITIVTGTNRTGDSAYITMEYTK